MKKTLIALLALGGIAMGESFTITMSELVSTGSITLGSLDGAYVNDVSSLYTPGNTVYDFSNGAIANITNTTLQNYFGGGKKDEYLTVAAWIKASSLTQEGSIFCYGGQHKGLMFNIIDSKLKVTAKGVADYPAKDAGTVTMNEWTLVAWTLDMSVAEEINSPFTGTSKAMIGDNMVDFTSGGWNVPATTTLAIGSGNSDNIRDSFYGEIANLTIFSSTEFLSAKAIADKVGEKPTLAVPEPATATLSLLALAGLAARRRRASH